MRQQLLEIQKQLTATHGFQFARPVSSNNFHMTLHFLGSVTEPQENLLIECLNQLKSDAFELTINNLGNFKKAGILWLGAGVPSEQLIELVNLTRLCIENCIADYISKEFIPHVSLFRKVNNYRSQDQVKTIDWKINSYVLVESRTLQEGVEYRVLKKWPLRQTV